MLSYDDGRRDNMSKPQMNLQDGFLNQVRKDGVMVTITLLSGHQLRGLVRGFDNFTVVLEAEGRQDLVYKHAIATISPSRHFLTGEPRRDADAVQRNG